MKSVIVNADDFGLIQSVNEGVLLAHREGILTNASLMANTPGFDQAVELAGQNKSLGVGVHLNILRGNPLSAAGELGSLVSEDGRFRPDLVRLYWRLIRRKIELDEVEKEMRLQIEKVLNAGIAPSHLDSEKHVHMLKPILKIVMRLAKEYRIPKIRFVREFCFSARLTQMGKSAFISFSSASMKKRMADEGIKFPDHFRGICDTGCMTPQRLEKTLLHLKEGVTEIMVHPGFLREDMIELEKTVGAYTINRFREQEMRAVMNKRLKDVVSDRGIRLINYHQF
ncbi:MAG: ChbG/HpnK family deacetylase [Candidatus Aminicenantes bacterium]|nr:ChbG/HpnK family deacetylase [Candidatus Aminicenantes bacterium]